MLQIYVTASQGFLFSGEICCVCVCSVLHIPPARTEVSMIDTNLEETPVIKQSEFLLKRWVGFALSTANATDRLLKKKKKKLALSTAQLTLQERYCGDCRWCSLSRGWVALPSEPAIPHVGIYPGEMATEALVHRSFVYNSPQV